jgi:hypothetical protein
MIVCPVCGKEVTVEEGYVLLDENHVVHYGCTHDPWAEGDKAAAPASEEQEDGERRTDGTH